VATGSTAGDLTAALQSFARSLLRPNGMSLIGTVLAEEAHTPELLVLFRERLVANLRAQLLGILRQAQRGGELRSGVSLDAAVNLLVGAFYARYLASSTIPPGFARELVEVVWRGWRSRDRPQAGSSAWWAGRRPSSPRSRGFVRGFGSGRGKCGSGLDAVEVAVAAQVEALRRRQRGRRGCVRRFRCGRPPGRPGRG
jgi:hypothetical protein